MLKKKYLNFTSIAQKPNNLPGGWGTYLPTVLIIPSSNLNPACLPA